MVWRRGRHLVLHQLIELRVLTLWESFAAIRAFAGEDLTTAVVASAAQAVLTSYDTTVTHYEIAESA